MGLIGHGRLGILHAYLMSRLVDNGHTKLYKKSLDMHGLCMPASSPDQASKGLEMHEAIQVMGLAHNYNSYCMGLWLLPTYDITKLCILSCIMRSVASYS